jgi:1-acyl-sn-glycerol-3-phosphate acyltransferase
MPGPVTILRNIAFAIAFYGGSFPLIGWAGIAALLGLRGASGGVQAWSDWHHWCVRKLLGIRIVVEGEVPTGGHLVASKHESFFEAIHLPALLDKPVPFAKAELWRIPGWGPAAARWGAVAVHREQGAKMLRRMITDGKAYAAEGRVLAIFPEGSRVPHGARPMLQSGFAGLYKMLGVPVVPMAVNSGPLYHRGWKRSGTITIRFGEVIPPGLPRDDVEARVREAINVLN